MEPLLWITREDGTVTGPHGVAYLKKEVDAGRPTLDNPAAQDGTTDWMPLETWGGLLYPPPSPIRRVPYARKLSAADYSEKQSIPTSLAWTIFLGMAGATYLAFFGTMNPLLRVTGLILCLGTTAIWVLVHISRSRR